MKRKETHASSDILWQIIHNRSITKTNTSKVVIIGGSEMSLLVIACGWVDFVPSTMSRLARAARAMATLDSRWYDHTGMKCLIPRAMSDSPHVPVFRYSSSCPPWLIVRAWAVLHQQIEIRSECVWNTANASLQPVSSYFVEKFSVKKCLKIHCACKSYNKSDFLWVLE